MLLGSLISASVVAGRKSYLADLIIPQEVAPRTDSFEDDKWDVMRDTFDKILRSSGWDEDSLSSLPKMIVSHEEVPMRDGVNISSLIVKNPLSLKKRPAIVSRSPYGTLGSNAVSLVFLVLNGYTAVIQDQRGTQKSGGVFDLWSEEGEDSTDVAEWIASQHWSNGEVFYCGGSADGMPGNMAVTGDPSRMKGEWQIWTAENGHEFIYPQGAYRQDLMEGYLNMMAGATRGTSRDVTIPKIESHEAFNDWYAQITLARNESDPSVQPFYYDKINWPIIDSVGWWDLFQHTHLTHWKQIRAHSDVSVRDQHVLVVGPLGHCIAQPGDHLRLEVAEADGLVVAAEAASEVFKGDFDGKMRSKIGRVNLFVMGSFHDPLGVSATGNYWTSLDDFPTPEPTKFFFDATGVLESNPPTESSMRQYVYDPTTDAGLTPMLGGNNLPGMGKVPGCGTRDQIEKANRTDILIFDSEPLSEDTPIAGDLSAQLYIASSAPDTDFFVTVEDLAPNKKKSMLVRYGMARMRWRCGDEVNCPALEAGEVYPIEIDLWASAYIFPKGHSVRVTVSSAAYPYYNANPNTGGALYSGDEPVAATNEIHISPEYPSSVSLPVVSASDIPKNENWGPVIPWKDVVV
jgi:putative CocE/NonD family hydrolase